MRHLLMIVSLLMAAAPASADIVKWVDAEGKVHYSDSPPTKAKSQKTLNIKNTAPSSAPTSAAEGGKTLVEKDLEFRKRAVEKEESAAKQAKAEAEEKRRKQNCAQARNQLQALKDGQRSSRYDEKGERVFLEDGARPAAIQEAQRTADSWCK